MHIFFKDVSSYIMSMHIEWCLYPFHLKSWHDRHIDAVNTRK